MTSPRVPSPPPQLFMLRGNHETRDVNGWVGLAALWCGCTPAASSRKRALMFSPQIEHYQTKSFLFQCKERFGADLGR
jgi:hypothetical protein